MCGRYATTRSDASLSQQFAVESVVGDEPAASYNAAPSQQHRVVLDRAPKDDPQSATRTLLSAGWGLVPSWAKDPKIGNRMINARSETVTEKPAFKAAAKRRRLLVPADGYIEWFTPESGPKQPYFLHRPGEGLAFAGLYELWPDPKLEGDDRWRWTYTILTTTANDDSGWVHPRSPVVLPETFWGPWLDATMTEPDDVRALLASVPEPNLTPRPISTAVNRPGNNYPEILDEVAAPR